MSDRVCLVVDDDPSIRAYIMTLLQREEHFETLQADGGRRALEIMKALGDSVDLIVSDVQMSGGDGVSFAHSVRQLFADVPIILVSGTTQPSDALEFNFVEKPFAPQELLQVVRRVLAPGTDTVSAIPTILSGR
jgi:two-component system response regulator FlrC